MIADIESIAEEYFKVTDSLRISSLSVDRNAKIGDYLYITSDGILTTLDIHNAEPIAVCCIEGNQIYDSLPRFVALDNINVDEYTKFEDNVIDFGRIPDLNDISNDEECIMFNGRINTGCMIKASATEGADEYTLAVLCGMIDTNETYGRWYLPAIGELYFANINGLIFTTGINYWSSTITEEGVYMLNSESRKQPVLPVNIDTNNPDRIPVGAVRPFIWPY